MEATKEIASCTEKLIENLLSEAEWNDKMLQPETEENWIALVKKRSQAVRGFFEENEACIAKLRYYCAQPMEQELAEALYEAARKMVLNGRLDSHLISEIADAVIPYYIAQQEEEKAIIAISIRNACLLDSYTRVKVLFDGEKLEGLFRYVIERAEHYDRLQNPKARRNIFYAFQNLILFYLLEPTKEDAGKAFDCVCEAKQLWNRPEVRAMDEHDPEIPHIVDELLFTEPLELDNQLYAMPGITEQTIPLMEDYIRRHKTSEDWTEQAITELLMVRVRENHGECTSLEAAQRVFDITEQLPEVNWAEDSLSSQSVLLVFLFCYITAMRMLTRMEGHQEERERLTRKLLVGFHKTTEHIPYRYLTSYINDVYQSVFSSTLPNLSDTKEIEQLIYELLIYRQPSTYLHSKMVERIAVCIAQKIIERKPELFCGIPGFPTPQSVYQKQEELLSLIASSALLHDVGKCYVTTVITRQSRRIQEDEFRCIKEHPALGAELLAEKPDFAKYRDVILGHHKTYDGKGGYPAWFDHTASPYRFVIELIAVSDAMDAATDVLGRNYAKGKDFYTLRSELQAGAGTRYHPEIVRLLSDEELSAELAAFTGEKRMEYCYEAYSRCLHFTPHGK